MGIDVILTAGAVAAAIGAIGVVVKVAVRLLRQVFKFFDEWFGEADHDGIKGRPGVMQSLTEARAAIKDAVAEAAEARAAASRASAISAVIAKAVEQLQPNGGSHLRDTIEQTCAAVGRIEADTASAAGRAIPSR